LKYSKFFFFRLNKNFLFRFNEKGGRNFLGRICVFHRGGSIFANYRFLDFFHCINSFGYILKIFKENVRTALLGVVLYFNGLITHIIIAEGVKLGALFFSGRLFNKNSFPLAYGFTLPLVLLPMFSLLYGIELVPYKGAKYMRAAGTSALCISHLANHCFLKLNSG